ncbi:hypothetical protein E2C01_093404 [Portunus trituberculatus]|uniref:Uncharacterized protein n=1 Tax=Portunus trituberculatus TaxID=210409 RepID=A0A5B7K0E9_PORTR|nr:hypothetical protein [Portunus trituberculatus]
MNRSTHKGDSVRFTPLPMTKISAVTSGLRQGHLAVHVLVAPAVLVKNNVAHRDRNTLSFGFFPPSEMSDE